MGRATLDLMIGVGQRLEIEPGHNFSAWTRFTQADRLKAIIQAEDEVWNDILIPYSSLRALRDLRGESFVVSVAPDYITSEDETISSDEADLPESSRIQKLIAIEVNGINASIYSQTVLQEALRYPYTRPTSSLPAAVLRGASVQLYPTGITGTVTFRYIKKPTWTDQGAGGISALGDVRNITDTDKKWTVDQWNLGYLIIAEATTEGTVYTPSDSDATMIEFTWVGGPANGIYGYRVAERESQIDGSLADLVELKAAIILLQSDQDAAETSRLQAQFDNLLIAVQPLLARKSKSVKSA